MDENEIASSSGGIVTMEVSTALKKRKNRYHKDYLIDPFGGIALMESTSVSMQ